MCFKNSLVAESINQNYSGINRMQKLLTHIEPILPLGPSFKGVSKGNIGPVWVDYTMKNIINVIKAGMIDLRDKIFLKINKMPLLLFYVNNFFTLLRRI